MRHETSVLTIAERINAERVVLAGWSRAILLQLAHPLVAQGVADHSDYRRDPWGRLQRTSTFLAATTYGTDRVAAEAVARVIAAARAGDDLLSALVSAVYGGRRAHPVLFGAGRWAGVASGAGGDRGARTYLRAHTEQTVLVECGDVGDPADIDTPADLRLLDTAAQRATKR